MNNGDRKDENGNEPRICQTKPDKKKREKDIGGGRGGKAATFAAQSGVAKSGESGRGAGTGSEEGGPGTSE